MRFLFEEEKPSNSYLILCFTKNTRKIPKINLTYFILPEITNKWKCRYYRKQR